MKIDQIHSQEESVFVWIKESVFNWSCELLFKCFFLWSWTGNTTTISCPRGGARGAVLTHLCPPFQHLLSSNLLSFAAPLKPLRDDSALRALSSLRGLRLSTDFVAVWNRLFSIKKPYVILNNIWCPWFLITLKSFDLEEIFYIASSREYPVTIWPYFKNISLFHVLLCNNSRII